MNIVYWVTVTLLVIIVILVYYFNFSKTTSPLDQYKNFVLNRGIYPMAFTMGREGDNYLNYYVDVGSGDLRLQVDPFPVNTDGLPYKKKVHGEITYTEEGFFVSKIAKQFNCPERFIWSQEKMQCITKPLCTATDSVGTVKGLDYYTFEYLEEDIAKIATVSRASTTDHESSGSGSGPTNKYHDRLYLICTGVGNDFSIGVCQGNQIYNQKAENPAGSHPCDLYDICSDECNGFKHRAMTNISIPIPANGFYVCENGKSVLHICNENEIFSSARKTCIEGNPCFEKPNGTTIPIENSTNSYHYCQNDTSFIIQCPNGTYVKDGVISCIVEHCLNPVYSAYYSNKWFSVPIAASFCIHNEPVKHAVDLKVEQFNVPLKIDEKLKNPKKFLFNEIIEIPAEQIAFKEGFSDTVTIPVKVPSGLKALAQFEFNVYSSMMPLNLMPTADMKYLTVDNKIIKFVADANSSHDLTTQVIGNAIDYAPFMWQNTEPIKFNANAKSVVELTSCGWVLLSKLSDPQTTPNLNVQTPTLLPQTIPNAILPLRNSNLNLKFYPFGICPSKVDTDRELWIVQSDSVTYITYSIPSSARGELLSHNGVVYPTPNWLKAPVEATEDSWFATSVNYDGIPIHGISQQTNSHIQSFTYVEWLLKYTTIDDLQYNMIPVGISYRLPSFETALEYPSYKLINPELIKYQPININRPKLF